MGIRGRTAIVAGAMLVVWAVGVGVSLAAPPAVPPPPEPPVLPKLDAVFGMPGVDAELLAGLEPVRTPLVHEGLPAGYIDWARGLAIAVGRGVQKGPKPADQMMAQRAARIVALRNALAAAAGVPIGPTGHVSTLRAGQIDLQGFAKDFQVRRTFSEKGADGKTYQVAEVHLPLYGATGLTGRVYDAQLKAHRELTRMWQRGAWAPPAAPRDVAGDVVVIDARGTGFQPSVYPVVADQKKQIVLDMQSVPKAQATSVGLVRYAKPAPAGKGSSGPKGPDGPTAKPTHGTRARRHDVRAVGVAKDNPHVLILDNAAALKMLRDPKVSRLARSGRVLIVIDAPAAGM